VKIAEGIIMMMLVPKTFTGCYLHSEYWEFSGPWVLSQNCSMPFLAPFRCEFLLNHTLTKTAYGKVCQSMN